MSQFNNNKNIKSLNGIAATAKYDLDFDVKSARIVWKGFAIFYCSIIYSNLIICSEVTYDTCKSQILKDPSNSGLK